ncbi:MAG: secondary thiamine-phosphate synthase enzyme YjbQ [Planctomycetaceae bacterium]
MFDAECETIRSMACFGSSPQMLWYQRQLTLPAMSRGFHLVTRQVIEGLPEIRQVDVGLLHVFIMHTSASLTINENADPDVPVDMEMAFNQIAPESLPYVHTMEGPDDMPAHVKATLAGSSVTIPVSGGRLALGTWQGIYLCEHRNRASGRKLMLTLQGRGQER